jgi:Caspase domain
MISRSEFGGIDAPACRLCHRFFAACLANQPALAGKRVALVIGNSSYQNVAALTNPANDATAITEMFKKASFDVVESRRDLKYM